MEEDTADTFRYVVSGIRNSADYARLMAILSEQSPDISELLYKGKSGILDLVVYKSIEYLDSIRDAGFRIELI